MAKYASVVGHPDLIKDLETGVIHFVNEEKRSQYKENNKRLINENQLKNDVDKLKNDMNDIKTMLSTLINK